MDTTRRALLAAAGRAAAVISVTAVAGTTGRTSARAESICATRYPGYSAADQLHPYAKYFVPRTAPVQPQIDAACRGSSVDPAEIPPLAGLPEDLSPTGYSAIETGYGSPDGIVVWAAAHTHMPRVSAEMWDWWFGWHSNESARYKLWHPDAHAYVSIARDLTDAPGLTDRERYIGNTSYVDEFIGTKMEQLAISFKDPREAGFAVPNGHTVIYGRVGSSVVPVDLGWLAHQVRPVEGGSEMRSRFYLNVPGLRSLNVDQARCAVGRGSTVLSTDSILDVAFGRDLMQHCGAEMNHLARFLPELYAEFALRPAVEPKR